MRCPFCKGTQGRCAATASGRWVTECCSCGRVVEERQVQEHQLFLLRAHDNPLCVVTPDLFVGTPAAEQDEGEKAEVSALHSTEDGGEEDPFEPTGFISAFSTWSLEPAPVFARSSFSFSGHLAELERTLFSTSSASSSSASSAADSSGPLVSVDHLRAYLQIIDVSSILDVDHDITDHAFQLFRDCSSTTCLRNRNIEALATAALVQAIREAQEPRTLQEISAAANLPQKEIGKYIKVLGGSLQLSQPINSNSIAVHMPRFCTLLQLNKSAQELAAHIGEVVINKCFCTRRNPISISAAAIYLACQLEDKRKTQAEICKVTGLTEVTLRKVYKELLENWDDLLPPNYTPAVPPEKAFPMTTISSGRFAANKAEPVEAGPSSAQLEREKHPTAARITKQEFQEQEAPARGKDAESCSFLGAPGITVRGLDQAPFGSCMRPDGVKGDRADAANDTKFAPISPFKTDGTTMGCNMFQRAGQVRGPSPPDGHSNVRAFHLQSPAHGESQPPSRHYQTGSKFASGAEHC